MPRQYPPRLCDITPRHGVTPLHYVCETTSLARESTFSTAAFLLLALLGQACVS